MKTAEILFKTMGARALYEAHRTLLKEVRLRGGLKTLRALTKMEGYFESDGWVAVDFGLSTEDEAMP